MQNLNFFVLILELRLQRYVRKTKDATLEKVFENPEFVLLVCISSKRKVLPTWIGTGRLKII